MAFWQCMVVAQPRIGKRSGEVLDKGEQTGYHGLIFSDHSISPTHTITVRGEVSTECSEDL